MAIFLFFLIGWLLHLAYWLILHRGFWRARPHALPPPPGGALPPLSVVVAARDEERVLPALLKALTRQTHPRYEVVVVNDASTDRTAAIVQEWSRAYSNIKLVEVETPHPPRKKHALTLGIQAASFELLAFTDADCAPPPGWLERLAHEHAADPGETLLVGYSPYRCRPGLLNKIASYETFFTGFLTAAAVGWNRPYMAVGRNLSYSKTTFQRIGGFAHSRHSLSGDDDLLVQEVARRDAASVRHVFGPSTYVDTDAPGSWRGWLHQKRRHASAGRFYDRRIQGHLALFQGTNILVWVAPFLAGWGGVALLAIKLVVQGAVLLEPARVFRERRLIRSLPLLELLYAGYNLLVAPLGLARIPRKW